jgi:DNA-binding response OmpR family regulator
MAENPLIQRIITEAALRSGLPATGIIPDLSSLGSRPRLGQVLDALNPARLNPASQEEFTVGPYRFVPSDHALYRDEATIRLTEKERDILLALLQAGDNVIDRKSMLETVWGYASGVETHTLETHIYRLRQKIEDNPAHPKIVRTVGEGYCLSGSLADTDHEAL